MSRRYQFGHFSHNGTFQWQQLKTKFNMFDQQRIARDIKKYCKAVFDEDNLTYTEEDIERGILIFFNLMRMKTPHILLNGFQEELEGALTKACITEQGEISSLLSIVTRFDGFLKRMYTFTTSRNYSDYSDKTQAWLIANLPGLPSVNGYNNESTRVTWKKNGTGAYPLACTLVARNIDTHNAPDWDKATVFDCLKYCLASFILVTLKLEASLTTRIPQLLDDPVNNDSITEEELQAYDFINYSRLTRALRSQVMECFIQRTLFKDGAMDEGVLEEKVHGFIGKKTSTTVKHRIMMLEHRGFIEREDDGRLRLSVNRRLEMAESEANCASNVLSFKGSLATILSSTALNGREDEIYAKLIEFLKLRYQQTTGAAFALENYEITEESNSFLDWINISIGDEQIAKTIYRNIIELCRHNGIVFSLAIGKAIAALADSKEEALLAAGMKRHVYLDSQVVLPMLCVAHKDFTPGEIWEFKNALQIKKQGRKDNLILRFAKSYLQEIYGHAQQALKLAPWYDSPAFGSKDFSRNVFYQHYIHLKALGKLPEDATTYPEYLGALFSLEPEEIELESARGKSKALCSEIDHMLEEDLGIEIHYVPHYDSSKIRDSQDTFSRVVRETHSSKGETAVKLDAIMGLFLFEEAETPRPIFVSRDATFNLYREYMALSYGRRNNYLWHLFSPTRFVVSNELIGMYINKDLLSDDLLMLLDNTNVRDNAKLFMDVNTRLTDIEGLTPAKARQRMKENFKFFSKQDIKSGSEEELEYLNELATELNTLWDKVRNYFSKTEDQARTFQNALLDENIYSDLMNLMASYISQENKQQPEFFKKIDDLISPKHEASDSEVQQVENQLNGNT